MLVLVDLDDLLHVRADGDEHPPGARELLDERLRKGWGGGADMDGGVWGGGGVACGWKSWTGIGWGRGRRTLSPVADEDLELLRVDGGVEPCTAQVLEGPGAELRNVLNACHLACCRGWSSGGRGFVGGSGTDERVEDGAEVSRAAAYVKDLRAGGEEREEVLERIGVLYMGN
jgi:hypothetical protein